MTIFPRVFRIAGSGKRCYTFSALGRKQVESLREPVAVGRIHPAALLPAAGEEIAIGFPRKAEKAGSGRRAGIFPLAERKPFLCASAAGNSREGLWFILRKEKGDAKRMRKSHMKSWLSLVLCLALLAAAALSTVSLAETATQPEENVILMTGTQEAPVVLGKVFLFRVIDPEGAESWFEIHASAKTETVGAALLENQLVEGTESEYGLYVTSVCGTELIWSEENPHYWAFYINDEYAQTGVDATPIESGVIYTFKAE